MQEVGHASMPGLGVVSEGSWSAKMREALADPGGGINHQLRGPECELGRGARRVFWIELKPRREGVYEKFQWKVKGWKLGHV